MVLRKQIKWLYKPANLDAEDYAEELQNLMHEVIPSFDKTSDTRFIPVTHEQFKRHCKKFTEKITEWGLIDRLAEVAMILMQRGKPYAIHRDFPTWKGRNIALNLPILNCEGTHTVWYDAEVINDNPSAQLGDNLYVRHSLLVKEETAVEIGRCPSDIPHWLNVYVPHAPISPRPDPRVTISVRFQPELFDLMENGVFDTKLSK